MCACVSDYLFVHVCVHANTCMRVSVHVLVCVCVCVFVCVCVHVLVHVSSIDMYNNDVGKRFMSKKAL